MDQSSSAIAQRKKLEAELAEKRDALNETYYDRSIENQQNALDRELEDFEKTKNDEITKWDEYLEDVELVVADSLNLIQENALGIYDTLNSKAQEYNLTLSNSILTPWQDGSLAVSDYQTTFDTAISSTMDQLDALKNKWQEVIDTMAKAAQKELAATNASNANFASATKSEPAPAPSPAAPKQETPQKQSEKAITVGGNVNAGSAKIYSYIGGPGYSQYYDNDPIYKVLSIDGDWIQVRHHSLSSGISGYFKKGTIKAYAKGTTGVDKDQFAWIDELGEELQLVPGKNGRLEYMKKGTSVVPANLTERLIDIAMDPQSMLEQNRPQIPVPNVVNNEINLSVTYGDMVKIENFNGDNPDEIAKIVSKQFEKHTKDLNNSLRKFVR